MQKQRNQKETKNKQKTNNTHHPSNTTNQIIQDIQTESKNESSPPSSVEKPTNLQTKSNKKQIIIIIRSDQTLKQSKTCKQKQK